MRDPSIEERFAAAPADLEGVVEAFTNYARRVGRRRAELDLRRICNAGVDEYVRRVLSRYEEIRRRH